MRDGLADRFGAELVAIHAGHFHVQEDHAIGFPPSEGKGCLAIRREVGRIEQFRQRKGHGAAANGVVIHDQDLDWRLRSPKRSGFTRWRQRCSSKSNAPAAVRITERLRSAGFVESRLSNPSSAKTTCQIGRTSGSPGAFTVLAAWKDSRSLFCRAASSGVRLVSDKVMPLGGHVVIPTTPMRLGTIRSPYLEPLNPRDFFIHGRHWKPLVRLFNEPAHHQPGILQ